MKKVNKKLLVIGLVVLFLTASLIFLVKAQEDRPEFYRVDSGTTTIGVTVDNKAMKIMNLSGNDFFLPNKTEFELGAFYHHLPNYVSISICGDNVCGPGETASNCMADCSHRLNYGATGFCGDGLCNLTKEVGDNGYVSTATEYPIMIESREICIEDCGQGGVKTCGICGLSPDGTACRNYCGDGNFNLTNCTQSYDYGNADLLVDSQGLLLEGDQAVIYFRDNINYNSVPVGQWYCVDPNSPARTFSCPDGYYCQNPQTVLPCPPGHYCPLNQFAPRPCPPGTYSNGTTASCVNCPVHTTSPARSTSVSQCVNSQVCGDGVCDSTSVTRYGFASAKENENNCPQDCSVINNGKCSVFENLLGSADCTCGNGTCDNKESNLSCPEDCPVIGDGLCHSSETIYTSPTDCAVCGDGQCSGPETRATCPADCLCGNGVCNTSNGENYTNCFQDCHCGNGVCDSSIGEDYYSCSADCPTGCGDGLCQMSEVYEDAGSSSGYATTCSMDCGYYVN